MLHDFKSELEAIRPYVRKIRNSLRDPLPNTQSVGVDGEDHINVWVSGETDLGQGLSHLVRLPFTHSFLGKFDSVESFWYYVRSVERDDRVRLLHGHKLKQFARKLNFAYVPNFRAVIMDANWQKIQQYPELMKDLKDSVLPLDCYYIHQNELRMRPAMANWVIYGFEIIRSALNVGEEPDFTPLMDRPKIDLCSSLKQERMKETAEDGHELRYKRKAFVADAESETVDTDSEITEEVPPLH